MLLRCTRGEVVKCAASVQRSHTVVGVDKAQQQLSRLRQCCALSASPLRGGAGGGTCLQHRVVEDTLEARPERMT
jgi:hypothetical protein